MQEYRRAESALTEAIERLGSPEAFTALEPALGSCGDAGCASLLLLRVGNLKARAQAERLDRLWRRKVASGLVLDDSLTCFDTGTFQSTGATCAIDADCGGASERCGASVAERSGVVLRQVAAESLAEGSIAQALYRRLLPSSVLAGHSDFAQLQSSLDGMTEAESRVASGVTPLGLPSDYVPMLSTVQEGVIGCSASCGSGCDLASFFQCLVSLAEGGGQLGIFTNAEQQIANAQMQADTFADQMRSTAAHRNEAEQSLRDQLVRLFGQPCTTCVCKSAPSTLTSYESLACVTSPSGEVWQIEGAVCTDGSPLAADCVTDNVDGELEQAIQRIRNAQLALENRGEAIATNAENKDSIAEDFANLLTSLETACRDRELAYEDAGRKTVDAINGYEAGIRKAESGGLFGGIMKGVQAAMGVAKIVVSTAANPLAIAGAGDLTGVAQQLGAEAASKRKLEAQTGLQRTQAQIQTELNVQLAQIACRQEMVALGVQESTALRGVETERRRLVNEAEEQLGAVVAAQITANRLIAELRRARERLDEAQEFEATWAQQSFRNPQNYRALAAKSLIDASDSFRSAQVLAWLILRAGAYDLAQPDLPVPLTFSNQSVVTIDACRQAVCYDTSGPPTQTSCITDNDCPGPQTCDLLTSADAAIADSDGTCSLQAVFSARSVADLRHLVRSAFLQSVVTFRTLASCPGGACRKTISLRDLFTDPSLGPAQPTLGSRLIQSLPEPELDFTVSLQRRYALCENLPAPSFEQVCRPNGIASLGNDGTGSGTNLADNIWSARALDGSAVVRYASGDDPRQLRCRNPYSGKPGGGFLCQTDSNCSQTACTSPLGFPGPCVCRQVFLGDPVAELVQLEPGVVRTSFADRVTSSDDGCTGDACPRDSFLSYQIRSGNLPLDGSPPSFDFFRVVDLSLYDATGTALANPNANIKGVPVASPRWHLRLDLTGLTDPDFDQAFIESIEDIEVIFNYQAFNLQP